MKTINDNNAKPDWDPSQTFLGHRRKGNVCGLSIGARAAAVTCRFGRPLNSCANVLGSSAMLRRPSVSQTAAAQTGMAEANRARAIASRSSFLNGRRTQWSFYYSAAPKLGLTHQYSEISLFISLCKLNWGDSATPRESEMV
jgi:hypothetical protein